MNSTKIIPAALLAVTIALTGLTGCRPPLILNNTVPADSGGTSQPSDPAPAPEVAPTKGPVPTGPGPIRCFRAPCP